MDGVPRDASMGRDVAPLGGDVAVVVHTLLAMAPTDDAAIGGRGGRDAPHSTTHARDLACFGNVDIPINVNDDGMDRCHLAHTRIAHRTHTPRPRSNPRSVGWRSRGGAP